MQNMQYIDMVGLSERSFTMHALRIVSLVSLVALFSLVACSENDAVPPVSAADAIKLADSVRTVIKSEVDMAKNTLVTGRAWTNSESKTIVSGSAVDSSQQITIDATVSLTNLALADGIWTVSGSCSYKFEQNVNNDETVVTFNVLAAPFRLVSGATNRTLSFRNLVIDTRQNAETDELTTTVNGSISIDGFNFSYPRN
jgi:major membrane immunogen (membrane-anchored lipoprotein)